MIRSLRIVVLAFLLGGSFCTPARAQTAASAAGTVTDAASREPLPGASVVLTPAGGGAMAAGTATDEAGRFRLTGLAAGDYVLSVRYIGYQEHRAAVALAPGEAATLDVALAPAGLDLNDVVVTASRQAEKILDAPASISVLDARELERDVTPSPVAVLRNTPGVDLAQTGVDRYEVVLRGFNNAFSGATYVLTDYRQSAVASLGVNAYNMMPLAQVDLERIEVVRGPGSALYGAGVDAGVVHFITKDPFTHPGTTVSIGGGERDLVMGALRHAGVVGDRLGYKLVGSFSRAEEWHFDPADELDRIQLESFRREALPVDYDNWKYQANGMLAYRFSPGVSLTANGGFASAKSLFLSGIGTLQAEGFGYGYGQLRLQAGRFFAQAYVNQNDPGDSFVYRRGALDEVIDYSRLVNLQAQYDFGLAQDRVRMIVGTDYELTMPDTDGTINGRNENDDTIAEAGAYAQASAVLSPRFDLTLALRGDYNNVVEELQLSPRAALVFKPAAGHSLRATFNRAFSSPGSNSLFLDINAGAAGPLTIRARGAAQGYAFERDPAFGGLVASSLIPSAFGARMPVGMPLGLVYGGVYRAIAAIPTAQLRGALAQQGVELSEEQVAGLVQALSPEAGTVVGGYTPGRVGFLNLTTLQIDRVTDDVVDIAPLQQTTSQTFELGYKGVLGDRVLLAVDGYYTRRRNFIGPLQVESPFVLAPGQEAVVADLQAALAQGIEGNPALAGQLAALGLPPSAVAALITQLAAPALASTLPAEGSPIGIVPPVGPGESPIPGQLLLTYRNYGDVDWYGVDAATQVLLSDRLNLFGNLSWVNDNFFTAEELDEAGSDLTLSMNAPTIKLKGGVDYAFPGGFRASASVRYTDGFEVRSGPYQGRVDAYTLLDLGAGYDLGAYVPGLRLDVTVLNALDDRRREFVGAPRIGRMTTAQLTYTR